MSFRIVESTERDREQAQVPVHSADATLHVADGVAAGEWLQSVIEDDRGSGIGEQMACFSRHRHPEQPFIVLIDRREIVTREAIEDDACFRRASGVDQQTRQGGTMDGIPREVVDRRPDGGFLLGDTSLLATKQESLHPRRGDVVPCGRDSDARTPSRA